MARVHDVPIYARSTFNKLLCYSCLETDEATVVCRLASLGDDVEDLVTELSEFRPFITQQEIEMFGETGQRTGEEYLGMIQSVGYKFIRPILTRAKRIRIDDTAQFEILTLYYSLSLSVSRNQ